MAMSDPPQAAHHRPAVQLPEPGGGQGQNLVLRGGAQHLGEGAGGGAPQAGDSGLQYQDQMVPSGNDAQRRCLVQKAFPTALPAVEQVVKEAVDVPLLHAADGNGMLHLGEDGGGGHLQNKAVRVGNAPVHLQDGKVSPYLAAEGNGEGDEGILPLPLAPSSRRNIFCLEKYRLWR